MTHCTNAPKSRQAVALTLANCFYVEKVLVVQVHDYNAERRDLVFTRPSGRIIKSGSLRSTAPSAGHVTDLLHDVIGSHVR